MVFVALFLVMIRRCVGVLNDKKSQAKHQQQSVFFFKRTKYPASYSAAIISMFSIVSALLFLNVCRVFLTSVAVNLMPLPVCLI